MQWFDPRMVGWYSKELVPKREEGREQTKENERDQHDQDKSVEGCKGSIPE